MDEEIEFRSSAVFNDISEDTESEQFYKVVMLRCGDIDWDTKNVICGWTDAKLSENGQNEVLNACIALQNDDYSFDLVFCSLLQRCKETLYLILTYLDIDNIDVIYSWQLNDRHCGGLTGHKIEELNIKYGAYQVRFWLNSYKKQPPEMIKTHKYYEDIYKNDEYPDDEELPLSESWEMVDKRIREFWDEQVCPYILAGRKILIISHNSCLQSLIQYLEDIAFRDFIDSKIPRGVPFYFTFDETLNVVLKDSDFTFKNTELEKKIVDAFEIFDHAGNKTVDIREIGTIIRSLGCVPTEAEIQEILVQTESPEATGSVALHLFLPHMVKCLVEHKYQPATPDVLLEAFRRLDPEGHGYIQKDDFVKLMMEEGEPFTQDEIDEMLATAYDPQNQNIPYEYYINQLMYEPAPENDFYTMADIYEATRPKVKAKTMSEILRQAQELEDGDY